MSTPIPHKPSHWWRVGRSTPRKRYPLRWRPGSTPPLVAWAEIRDWGQITIRRQPDGLLEARIVDKTRRQAAVVVGNLATTADAKKRSAEAAQEMIAARRTPSAEVMA